VYLPQIGKPWLSAGEVPVSNESASVGISFDAITSHKPNFSLGHFAEMASAICGNRAGLNPGAFSPDVTPGSMLAKRHKDF